MEIATKDDFDALAKDIDEMKALLSILQEKTLLPSVVYVSDIAKVERLSITGIKKEPWLLPNFGISEYPGRARWSFDTYREWRSRPVKERHRAYLTHLRNMGIGED